MKSIFVLLFLVLASQIQPARAHTFEIRDGNFQLDGKPFYIHSGEMHFARIPKAYWRHRLKMAKAMGLNTIATYVFWNYHEVKPDVWDFKSESRGIAEFIRTAQEEGLWVILRPGPYACAEWEFGGYPWFLQKEESLVVRSNNPKFLNHTKAYIDALAGQVRDLQVTHGGPIIMTQIENEYGSYSSDMAYKLAIKKQLEEAGFDVPFFTSDGDWLFDKGTIPGVLPAANGEDNIDTLKARVNRFNGGKGPYMVAEFYPGWLDHWAEPFERVPKEDVANQMAKYLKAGVSFNLYMFHGGTNFGYSAGANYDKNHDIQPDITSYDYDAPLSEAGWATPKYMMLRDTIRKYVDEKIPPVPDSLPVIAISSTSLTGSDNMFDAFTLRGTSYSSHQPLSFEEMSTDNSAAQGYGLYTKSYDTLGGYLSFYGLRDFGLAYTDHHYAAMLNRYYKTYGFTKYVPNISELELLVESMGRINYGSEIIHNQKGIIGPVSYTIPLKERSDWKIYRLPYDTVPSPLPAVDTASANNPAEYWGTFSLDSTGDTFLDMRDWGKGIVFVNGHNLGRYWNAGPQQTLYVPGCWLKKGTNDIFLVDILNYTKHTTICALRTPILDQLNTKIAGIIARYDSARHATAVSMALTDSLPGEIYYTIDGGGQHPYKEPLYVDRSSRITAWGTRNGVRSEIDSRIAITPTLSFGKEVSTVNPWSDRYSAEGKYTLVDGIGGSGDHHDGTWQGYEGVDLNATVDLGSERAIKEMQLRCLQDNGSWIFLPDTVSYYGSDDGIHFVSIGTLSHQSKREDQKLIKIEPFTLRKELKARYIKVIAKNIGTCPAWHPGAGGKSWLFVDEILIY